MRAGRVASRRQRQRSSGLPNRRFNRGDSRYSFWGCPDYDVAEMVETQAVADGTGTLRSLVDWLVEHPSLREIQQALHRGEPATWDGAMGSACALAVAAAARVSSAGVLVVTPTATRLEQLVEDLEPLSDEPLNHFPAWESPIGQRLVYDEVYADRLRTLTGLLAEPPRPVVLTTIHALLQPTPIPDAIRENTLRLTVGQTMGVEGVARWLVQHGFQHVSGVELPGEFARRGGILDLFAPAWDDPVRMEWFDDEIESIRHFDVGTQRTIEPLQSADVTVLPSGGDDPMRASQVRAQLTHFLPGTTCLVLLEPDAIQLEAQKLIAEDGDTSLFGLEETLRATRTWPRLDLTALATAPHPTSVPLPLGTVEQFQGDAKQVREQLDKVCADQQVTLLCTNEGEQQRLAEFFEETNLSQSDRLHFELGALHEGFRVPERDLIVLSGAQLFGRHEVQRRRRRRHLGKKIDTFLDLREGDLVVHLSHGIGRYRGLEMLRRENQLEEHLVIEFRGGTKIYVPATKIDLVQKYVGGSKARPRLATIGGRLWQQRKKAAALAVTDLAGELLEVQAKRAARPGIAFASDTEWQREFDASFPYEETEDQMHAIEAIKADMEAGRPMDRLLCGDVGFGKTEIAMRAAFKAVDNGYQVAVLVPTTILVEQHYRSFRERVSEFPFEIAKLSRFSSPAEQRETVQDIATGKVDIVIGTHRLASKDVEFENLGLLIIDEEQRFGVEIKERLKAMRATIDVLTMTATPIPRTLHMSMTGLREISNLESAPEDRVSVETRVTRWDDELIRRAVLREMHRGGQVYFVHNRVQDIMTLRAKLEAIVPEARITVGHGQMPEGALEEVMVDFVEGEYDVLLATTIVESGLDIPNANTIFIDEADRFGLADLHQLRGRVGRYKHRAYCYLLIDRRKHVTPEAARRLRAIEEFSELGAGFAIAMRDLEFRGAGNVLGSQQSGHIAAIGYELYCELLEAEVRRARKLPPKISIDVNIDLPGDAFIPEEYIVDQRMRIDLYRRMNRVASEHDSVTLREEIEDRFGSPPPAVLRLLALAELRIDAAIWQVAMVRLDEQDGWPYLVFDYTDRGRIKQLSKLHARQLRIVDDHTACWQLPTRDVDPESVLALAKSVLRPD